MYLTGKPPGLGGMKKVVVSVKGRKEHTAKWLAQNGTIVERVASAVVDDDVDDDHERERRAGGTRACPEMRNHKLGRCHAPWGSVTAHQGEHSGLIGIMMARSVTPFPTFYDEHKYGYGSYMT